jgi:drug/metabolite transporter (DMT)-like permease
MRVAERATPLAAMVTAFSSLACCLPLGFVGAAGLAGLSTRVQFLRLWLLVGAVALLAIGFVQLYVGRNQCRRRSPVSVAIFGIATAVVLLLILFPQIAATILAG